DRHDPGGEPSIGARLRPDRDASSDRKDRQAFFRDLDPQIRRLDLERQDRIPGRDEFSLAVIPRQDDAARRGGEGAFLREAPALVEPRPERPLLRVEVSLLGLARPDARGDLLALVLEGLEIRRRRQPLRSQARHPLLLARDLRELGLELRDRFLAGLLLRGDLLALPLVVRRVLGQPGLLDAGDDASGLDRLPLLRDLRHEPAAAGKGEVEVLFLGDRQELDAAAIVVFLTHQRPVAPGARHRDRDRQGHPDSPFHRVNLPAQILTGCRLPALMSSNDKPLVAILMGSKSDWDTMRQAGETLAKFGVGSESRVLSAHRSPDALVEYVRSAEGRGIEILIAGAGGAAHLAGAVAA